MPSDRGGIEQHFGTRASLRKGGSTQSSGKRATRYRDRASRRHARIFSEKGRRISRRGREPVKGANEHSLARTYFAESHGWRGLRHPGSNPTGKIGSL